MSCSKATFCFNEWHQVVIIQNQTVTKAHLNNSLILSQDIDPRKKFVALNCDHICYLWGVEYGQKVNIVTQENFKGFCWQNQRCCIFPGSKKTELIKSGYHIYNGDEQN